MKAIFGLMLIFSSDCFAGNWERISKDTIMFTGFIEESEFDKFQAIFRNTDKTLIVNSGGGYVVDGLKIGQIIDQHHLDIIVRGICASSCANYLFIAGHRKFIENGIVGFHGNWKAFFDSPKYKKQILQALPENTLKAEKVKRLSAEMVPQEINFFVKAGVSQEFFDKTQKENDDGLYDLYLPSPSTFTKYGIKNVYGVQNLKLLEQTSSKVLFE